MLSLMADWQNSNQRVPGLLPILHKIVRGRKQYRIRHQSIAKAHAQKMGGHVPVHRSHSCNTGRRSLGRRFLLPPARTTPHGRKAITADSTCPADPLCIQRPRSLSHENLRSQRWLDRRIRWTQQPRSLDWKASRNAHTFQQSAGNHLDHRTSSPISL